MAHKVIDGRAIVDWTTGDTEGDRIVLLAAYRDLIIDIQKSMKSYQTGLILENWSVDTDNQVDEVPRIWIKRPE